MRKFIIVSDFVYPNFAGGSSKHVYDLMRLIDRELYDVRLITRAGNRDNVYAAHDVQAEQNYNVMKERGEIIELGGVSILNPWNYICALRGADFILIEHPIMGLLGVLLARLMGGKKVICHYHGPIHLEYELKVGKKGPRFYALWLMQWLAVALSDKIMFHSRYMWKVAVREHGMDERKCFILPPYIEVSNVNNEQLPFSIDSSKTSLLIPRRLTARTGVLEFLDQFLKLPVSQREHYMVYITGTGELSKEVEKIAFENPLNVRYLGFITYDQLWILYRNVDSVVVPTLNLEGFGYIILEALSCGTPALVSKSCGGGYDFVCEELGEEYTFDVYSEKEIIDCLELIKSRPHSRPFYQNIATRYTPQIMIDSLLNTILK